MIHREALASMEPTAREALGEELDVTSACFPVRRGDEEATMAGFAEQLTSFAADTIREAFQRARFAATNWAPTPSQVRAHALQIEAAGRRLTSQRIARQWAPALEPIAMISEWVSADPSRELEVEARAIDMPRCVAMRMLYYSAGRGRSGQADATRGDEEPIRE